MRQRRQPNGFTLIELVMVIIIVGVMATVIAPILSGPFTAYTDSNRRANLVQQAHSTVQRVQLDLASAVPGSVLVGTDTLRWRPLAQSPNPARQPAQRYPATLDVSTNQLTVPVLGCPALNPNGETTVVLSDPNTAVTLDNTTPLASDNCDSSPPTATLNLSTAHTFDANGIGSLFNRLFLAGPELTYECSGNELRRYPTATPANYRLVADNLTACEFSDTSGGTQNAPTLLLDLTLADPARPTETVRLVRLLQLENAL